MEIRDVNRPWFRNHLMSALGRYLPVVTGGYRPEADFSSLDESVKFLSGAHFSICTADPGFASGDWRDNLKAFNQREKLAAHQHRLMHILSNKIHDVRT